MNPVEHKKLVELITKNTYNAVLNSWRGSKLPAEARDIEAVYDRSKKELESFLKSLAPNRPVSMNFRTTIDNSSGITVWHDNVERLCQVCTRIDKGIVVEYPTKIDSKTIAQFCFRCAANIGSSAAQLALDQLEKL